MRLFFALWPNDDVARQFDAAAKCLALGRAGRLVPSGNLHLTLAFLGEVSDEKLAVLLQIAGSIRAARFTVVGDCLEYWPQPQAVVTAIRNPPAALLDLSSTIHHVTGLPRLPLRAHVTLARKVAQAPVLPAMSSITWHATEFSLIRSQTGGAASAYTVLGTWPLLYET